MTDCPCHECHATQLAAVLTDLIAELRDRAQHYGPATRIMMEEMANRAAAATAQNTRHHTP